jgi:hypothetical protein
MKYFKTHSEFLNEAKLSKIHNAAKKGSYPVSLVVVEDGKVVKQELVGTPQIVPAAFNQLKKEYPNATVHVESKTGKRLFSESVAITTTILNNLLNDDEEDIEIEELTITEARAYKLKASEFGGDTFSAPYAVKGENGTWRVHSTYAIDQVSGKNNPEERDVIFFEAMPFSKNIYIKIGGINNLKRSNGATVGNNFSTTPEEWKKDPKGIAKKASDFLTDATHLKWLNKKARSQGQKIKWALNDDYSSVIEDLVNRSLGLKESIVAEGKFNKRSLMKAMKKDDGMIQLGNGQEYVIYNPNNGNDDNADMWQDKVIFGLDQDGEEHEIEYSDIVRYDESRKINLKAAHLSSEEYQKAKKLKAFNKEDWEWNSKSGLYDRVNEATDMNDPVLVAFRATRRELPKLKPAKAKSRRLSFDKYMDLLDTRIDIDQQIKDLGDEMAQTLRDMEQEAEPEGGKIADEYGSIMMKQEKEYAKLKAKKDKIMARIDKHRMD